MGIAFDFLRTHLKSMASPYLFVGAGLSRRYANLPDWEGLLRHFASFTEQPYEYYRGLASNDLPGTASKLAAEFYKIWWTDNRFQSSREQFGEMVTDPSSALKIEVAKYFEEAISTFQVTADYEAEFDLLRKANVEAIITTNFDRLMSVAFPDYNVYKGQDELLFADSQGIAEIYMIHGSSEVPASLVLTAEDYIDFEERGAYLAAKLMTIFAEHPIVFLGYSFNDRNIQSILRSLVKAMRGDQASQLKDRLIFIKWAPAAEQEVRSRTVQIEGSQIEAHEIVVADFLDVFKAIGLKERALPARILRQLKDQVYELVKSNDPEGRLLQVADIESSEAKLDVVFGVGVKMTFKGVVGLSRWDLVDDLIGSPDRGLPSDQVITEAFGRSFANSWYVPYWKYLRKGNFLDANGELLAGAEVPEKIRSYILREKRNLGDRKMPTGVDFQEVVAQKGEEWVIDNPWSVLDQTADAEGIRAYLEDNKAFRQEVAYSTKYAKLAIVLDWLLYGPPHGGQE